MPPRQRQLFKNIIYVGALSAFFDIEFEVLESLLAVQFKGKEKLIEPNIKALKLGVDFVQRNYPGCLPRIRVERATLGESGPRRESRKTFEGRASTDERTGQRVP